MLDNIAGLHIELTNRCTLRCPKCSRTEFQNQFGMKAWENHDVDLAALQKFLDFDLSGLKVNLCGTYGDPIYYKDLHRAVEYFKSRGAWIELTTNGSYRDDNWWQSLSALLDQQDIVNFSIDGLPENFTQYRVNADWESILIGFKHTVASGALVRYKYIPFAFNEESIGQAKQLATDLGAVFHYEYSDRWTENDPLKPKHKLVSARSEGLVHWHSGKQYSIIPKCKKNNLEHYISADGYYIPCCFISDYRSYYKTVFHKEKERFNISKTTLSSVLKELESFYSNIEVTPLDVCKYHCSIL